MDLEERIASLISPGAWTAETKPEAWRKKQLFRARSLDAARRVIDGLDILRDYDPQEDA